jgi:hypothetical protein
MFGTIKLARCKLDPFSFVVVVSLARARVRACARVRVCARAT